MQAIWERILDVQDVSVTMDFFGLGGNSLQVPMILHAINQTFEIALTVRQFHSRPCIRDLCLYIQSTRFKESNISK
jgi:Phosphopantetheine attachment site.